MQVLASQDADELDTEEARAADGTSQLMVDRVTAWQHICLRQTLELAVKAERLQAC